MSSKEASDQVDSTEFRRQQTAQLRSQSETILALTEPSSSEFVEQEPSMHGQDDSDNLKLTASHSSQLARNQNSESMEDNQDHELVHNRQNTSATDSSTVPSPTIIGDREDSDNVKPVASSRHSSELPVNQYDYNEPMEDRLAKEKEKAYKQEITQGIESSIMPSPTLVHCQRDSDDVKHVASPRNNAKLPLNHNEDNDRDSLEKQKAKAYRRHFTEMNDSIISKSQISNMGEQQTIPLSSADSVKDGVSSLSSVSDIAWGRRDHHVLIGDTNNDSVSAVTLPGAVSVSGVGNCMPSVASSGSTDRADEPRDPMYMESSITAIAVSKEDLEEEVRQRILREAVQATVQDMPEQRPPDRGTSRPWQWFVCFAIVLILVICISVGATLATQGNNEDPVVDTGPTVAPTTFAPTVPGTQGPTNMPSFHPTQFPTMSPTTAPERVLAQFLSARSFDSGKALRTAGTPQRNAFLFLLDNYDKLQFDAGLIDLYVLLTLYNCAHGSWWSRNENWYTVHKSVCNWEGITCDTRSVEQASHGNRLLSQGFVSEISLSNNNMVGFLPPELGMLGSRLISLDVSGNMLFGDIPSELGKLTRLQSLNLQGNNLSGEISESICKIAADAIVVDCASVMCDCCTPACPAPSESPSIAMTLSPTRRPSLRPSPQRVATRAPTASSQDDTDGEVSGQNVASQNDGSGAETDDGGKRPPPNDGKGDGNSGSQADGGGTQNDESGGGSQNHPPPPNDVKDDGGNKKSNTGTEPDDGGKGNNESSNGSQNDPPQPNDDGGDKKKDSGAEAGNDGKRDNESSGGSPNSPPPPNDDKSDGGDPKKETDDRNKDSDGSQSDPPPPNDDKNDGGGKKKDITPDDNVGKRNNDSGSDSQSSPPPPNDSRGDEGDPKNDNSARAEDGDKGNNESGGDDRGDNTGTQNNVAPADNNRNRNNESGGGNQNSPRPPNDNQGGRGQGNGGDQRNSGGRGGGRGGRI